MGENKYNKDYADRTYHSIISTISLYSSGDSVEIIPIIDRILVMIQSNIGIEIIDTETKDPIFSFSTILNRVYEKANIDRNIFDLFWKSKEDFLIGNLLLSGHPIDLYVYSLNEDDDPIELSQDKKESLENLIKLIESRQEERGLSDSLIKAFKKSRIGENNESDNLFFRDNPKINTQDLDLRSVEKCREAIREILNDTFKTYSKDSFIYNEDHEISQVFGVIRYPSDLRRSFGYTAQILFSKNQKKKIEEENFSIDELEKPLKSSDKFSLSLGDRSFELGTVQFGLPFNTELQRDEETRFYTWLLDNAPPKSVFYIPIHVNGVPWIAIYRVLGEGKNESSEWQWEEYFQMYTLYTPLIADKIRTYTYEKFLHLVDSFVSESLKTNSIYSLVSNINKSFEVLSCFFPFPVPIFKENNSHSDIYECLNKMKVNFELRLNHMWSNSVKFSRKTTEEIKVEVVRILDENLTKLEAELSKERLIQSTYSLGHNLKNRLLGKDKYLEELKRELEELPITRNKRESLQRIRLNLSVQLGSLGNIGNLLDMIGKTTQVDSNGTFFTEKENWYVSKKNFNPKRDLSKDLNVFDFLRSFYKDKFYAVNIDGKESMINVEDLNKGLEIKRWIKYNNELIRPANFIYEEIFFELFINALSYGYECETRERKYVKIKISSNEDCIIVSNTPGESISEIESFKNLPKDCEISSEKLAHGGLLYIHNFLSQTKIGRLNIRLNSEENKFEILLQLKGLK